MGILNQKLKNQLQKSNITPLPTHYTQVQPKVYQSTQTKIKLTSHSLVLQSNQIQPFLNSAKFRCQHLDNLVQILHAQVKKQQMQYCKLLIFIENISLNLEQLMLVHFTDMLNILYFSIPAFAELLKFHGRYFTIESYMIGINDEGRVKVWLNRDRAKHQPKVCYSFAKSGGKEQAEQNMVKELKTLFFCKLAKNTVPLDFGLQSNTFSGLKSQLEAKFGKEMFVNNLQRLIQLRKTESKLQNGNQNSSRILVKDAKAPFIRFNYEVDRNLMISRASQNPIIKIPVNTARLTPTISINYSNNHQETNLKTSQVKRIH